jgi:hypothetical protein
MKKLTVVQKRMIEEFQCPGCVCGSDTDSCSSFEFEQHPNDAGAFRCKTHVPGTMMLGAGTFALGLPKGFNKCGANKRGETYEMPIFLYEDGSSPVWDNLNVPVWAMVQDGYLFVRLFSPRINKGAIQVIEGGTLDMCPDALDVGKFIDEID